MTLTNRIASQIKYPLTVIILLATMTASTKAVDAESGQQWALLIGVERYEKVRPLVYTIRDAQKLGETLRDYGGY